MTREENIHWLNVEIRTWENECQSKHPIKEALYAARKALEKEPTTTVLQEIREEIRKDAEWWSEHDSLREQVLRDVIEDIIDKHIGDME